MYCNKCVYLLEVVIFHGILILKSTYVSSVTHNKQIWLNTLCLSYIAEMSF